MENEGLKPSRKSKMKKRDEDWEQEKLLVAGDLGLLDKIRLSGWSALSAEESGRLGGVFASRKNAVSAEEVINAEIFPLEERNL